MLIQIFADQLKQLIQPGVHNLLNVPHAHLFIIQPHITGEIHRPMRHARVGHSAAMLKLQAFGPCLGKFHAHRQIIGNMLAAHRQHSRVAHGATQINRILRGARTQIDHQCTLFAQLRCENRQGGYATVKGHILHINAQPLHHPHRILDPSALAANHMHIHLQFGGHTAHRLLHIILTIDPKMLAHGVQHLLIRR